MIRTLIFVAALSTACTGASSPTLTQRAARTDVAPLCGQTGSSEDIYARLAPTCVGCHGASASLPYFASFKSFQTLLVPDRRFVVPGHPEQSGLMALLEGTATGAYVEMPLGKGFKQLEAEQATLVSSAEVRAWLTALTEQQTVTGVAKPDPNARTVRALRASELTNNLMELLELNYDSFGASAAAGNFFRDHTYFIYPLNDLPIAADDWAGRGRFQALGGANYLGGSPPTKEITAAAVQVLLQASIRYCGNSVPVLTKRASLTDTSATNPAAIHDNIRYLFLRFDGIDATAEQVEEVYQEVYLPYELNSTSSAWTAVCSHLLQRPEALLL